MKVVVLIGNDGPFERRIVSRLIELPEVRILAVLCESGRRSIATRIRNLRRNIRREGPQYIFYRFGEWVSRSLETLASGMVPRDEVRSLLERAFPHQAFPLRELVSRHAIEFVEVGSLNSPVAVSALNDLSPDLGIVIGTRILRRSTFSIPRLGCINVHLGKVPEYRGMPPGFWELYHSQGFAGVTIHHVDDGLDTGDVILDDSVPISPNDSPVTLQLRLQMRAIELLVQAVRELVHGRARRVPQGHADIAPRSSPTRRQRRELEQRLPSHVKRQDQGLHAFKTVLYLAIYYSGLLYLIRRIRCTLGMRRVCILLYHRVNDLCDDVLTTAVERFAEHMVMLGRHYRVIPTSMLIESLQADAPLLDNSVVIHFDDCYRDVYLDAAPILVQVGFPACSFIASGFIDTNRVFPHDLRKCPFMLENLKSEDLPRLVRRGFEIGSHTVDHVDLGQCDVKQAITQLRQSKADLETLIGKPITWFSFPFGRPHNIRPEIVPLVREAGYEAMFSAYGGYVRKGDDLFHLRRIGISGRSRPLDLLMDVEGLSLGVLKRSMNERT